MANDCDDWWLQHTAGLSNNLFPYIQLDERERRSLY
jgi:hypothetical protein